MTINVYSPPRFQQFGGIDVTGPRQIECEECEQHLGKSSSLMRGSMLTGILSCKPHADRRNLFK